MRTLTTTTRGTVAHATITPEQVADRREQRISRAMTRRSANVTSCSRCSSYGACPECARINMVRLTAGLIENKNDPTDHANNICVQPMSGKFRGHRPIQKPQRSPPGICAKVIRLGGGWRAGVAMLGGVILYRGPATRSSDEAWAFAQSRLDVIKMGL